MPTVAESGLPCFKALSWSAQSAVKGTPQTIVDRLEAAMKKIMAAPEFRQRLETVGFVVPPRGGAAYTQLLESEIELWGKVIRTAGIKAE